MVDHFEKINIIIQHANSLRIYRKVNNYTKFKKIKIYLFIYWVMVAYDCHYL